MFNVKVVACRVKPIDIDPLTLQSAHCFGFINCNISTSFSLCVI